MSKKKVLYYMPDNPLKGRGGNLTRCNQMLSYFQKKSDLLDVHFISSMDWDSESKEEFYMKYPSINLKIFPFKMSKSNIFEYLIRDKIPKEIEKALIGDTFDSTTPYFRSIFKKDIAENQYDIVVISYAIWGNLIKDIEGPYFIIDTHDFMTLQYKIKTENTHKLNIGSLFKSEMDILKKFDEIWTYSIEEQYIFEQFTDKKVNLVPVSFPVIHLNENRSVKYEVLYVASDNPHNVKSIKWFLDKVFPFLQNIDIYIIGKICDVIEDTPNIIKLGIVDDLEGIYRNTRICICPMVTGTGVKIKVLESLSYGLPMVTTRRGVDGLINKSQNGCMVSDEPSIFADNIKQLLNDQQLYSKMKAEAQSYFTQNHDEQREEYMLNQVFIPN
jgi:glycosyltransferase involved in cell wall biosynthesis